jgi:hypothetical protein
MKDFSYKFYDWLFLIKKGLFDVKIKFNLNEDDVDADNRLLWDYFFDQAF